MAHDLQTVFVDLKSSGDLTDGKSVLVLEQQERLLFEVQTVEVGVELLEAVRDVRIGVELDTIFLGELPSQRRNHRSQDFEGGPKDPGAFVGMEACCFAL